MGKYRLYASGATQLPPPVDGVGALQKDTPFDNFVALLPSQVLILRSKADSSGTSQVNIEDEMIKWFLRIDETPSVFITFLDSQAPHAPESFQINLATPWPMKYTSTVEDLQNAFPDSSSQLSVGGLAPDGRWLVCALSKTMGPIKSTVTALFDCACIADMTKFVPKTLLGLSVTLQQENGTRNAVWFAPYSTSPQTIIHLQFKIDAILELQNLIEGVLKGLKVETADVICKQDWGLAETTKGMKAIGAGNVMFATRCSILTDDATTPKVSFNTSIEISETAMTLTFLIRTPAKSLTTTDLSTASTDLKTPGFLAIIKWLADVLSSDLESFMDEVLIRDDIASRIHLRRLIVRLDTTKGSSPILDYVSLDVEISTTAFGQAPGATKPIVFLISYTWSKRNGGAGTIRGSFWNGKFDGHANTSFENFNKETSSDIRGLRL